jgi:uncharacterized coiled-coil DUF342 family protein
MTKLLVILTSLTCTLLAVGCRDRDRTRDERPGYSKTAETADEDFTQSRSMFSRHVNERLDQLDAKIHELAARGDVKAREAADELRAERDRLRPQVDEIGQHAREGWDRFESEVSSGVDRLEQKLDRALQNTSR